MAGRPTAAGTVLHTLTPTPTASHCSRSPCQRPSHRMPAILRSSSSTSLGHLSRVPGAPSRASTASATAKPARIATAPTTECAGRSSRPSQTPPTGERDEEADGERHRADGRYAYDHVAAFDQRRPRNDGDREQEAELGRRHGCEPTPQRGTHRGAGA